MDPDGMLYWSMTQPLMKRMTRSRWRSAGLLFPAGGAGLAAGAVSVGPPARSASSLTLSRAMRLPADFDGADLFHALLAFLLLFEELPFTGDVAAVTFRGHVLRSALTVSRTIIFRRWRPDGDFVLLARDECTV